MDEEIKKYFPDYLNKPDYSFGLTLGKINNMEIYFIYDDRLSHSIIKKSIFDKLNFPYVSQNSTPKETILLPTYHYRYNKVINYLKAPIHNKVDLTCQYDNGENILKSFYIIDDMHIDEYAVNKYFGDSNYVAINEWNK